MPEKYSNLVFFFSSNSQCTKMDDVISERKQQLKQSLSKALVPFYPLVGKINGNLEIECNDHGVYYVEARAKIQLLEFLCKPEDELINRLFAVDPNSVDILSKKYVLMVQVSIFDCGGIAIGLNASHKIVDAFSMSTFRKAWAARTRESAEQINPSFISSSLFPPIPDLCIGSKPMVSNSLINKDKYTTRRFVFKNSAIAAASSSAKPSSVIAVMALVWSSAIAASRLRCEEMDFVCPSESKVEMFTSFITSFIWKYLRIDDFFL